MRRPFILRCEVVVRWSWHTCRIAGSFLVETLTLVCLCARNNEVQFAGQLQPKGCCYTLKVPAGHPEVFLSFLFFSFC